MTRRYPTCAGRLLLAFGCPYGVWVARNVSIPIAGFCGQAETTSGEAWATLILQSDR